MNNIAQKKANSYPGKQLVDRSRMMSAPRVIPSRGTVQRAQDPNAVAPAPEPEIRWSFLSNFPLSVEIVLKKMPDQIPDFKDLCQKVIKKKGGLFLKTFDPVKGGPQGAYIQGASIYVNKNLDHDEMVNLIVFELTNLLHSHLLDQASQYKNKDESAEYIERVEYSGVLMQSGIMNQAKASGMVAHTKYSELTKKGGRWETVDKYLEEQKKTGHTARYHR